MNKCIFWRGLFINSWVNFFFYFDNWVWDKYYKLPNYKLEGYYYISSILTYLLYLVVKSRISAKVIKRALCTWIFIFDIKHSKSIKSIWKYDPYFHIHSSDFHEKKYWKARNTFRNNIIKYESALFMQLDYKQWVGSNMGQMELINSLLQLYNS